MQDHHRKGSRMETVKIDLTDPGIAYAMRQTERNPFSKHNGIRWEEVTRDVCRASLVLQDWQKNPHGTAHGGLLFTLADAICGVLARADGREYVTLDASIHYLRNIKNGCICGEGTMIRRGKSSAVMEVILRDEEKREMIRMTVTMFCIGKGYE